LPKWTVLLLPSVGWRRAGGFGCRLESGGGGGCSNGGCGEVLVSHSNCSIGGHRLLAALTPVMWSSRQRRTALYHKKEINFKRALALFVFLAE
jgi:hypothetical protein